jgi:hypothetical protein
VLVKGCCVGWRVVFGWRKGFKKKKKRYRSWREGMYELNLTRMNLNRMTATCPSRITHSILHTFLGSTTLYVYYLLTLAMYPRFKTPCSGQVTRHADNLPGPRFRGGTLGLCDDLRKLDGVSQTADIRACYRSMVLVL